MRPIDADAAKNKAIICTNAAIFGDESEEMTIFARTVLDFMLMALEDAPTVEAEPVRHGRWVHQTGDVYMCTSCKADCHVAECIGDPMFEYCPYCGAKMDGAP